MQAASILALPSSASRRSPVLGSFAMPAQGEADRALGRVAFLARQPSLSQSAQPAGRGAGGGMGELQEEDNARVLASSTREILMAGISSLEFALAQRGTSAPELLFFKQTMGWEKRACVHGLVDGMEKDSVGNPSSKQALSRVSWLGMGESRLDERKCERLVQRKRLDLKRVWNKGLPEETRSGEIVHLGNGLELHTSSKKVGVPERLLVMHYLTVLANDWEGIRGSKEGVYAPEHPDFEYFQSMSALILARLEFLNQTLMYLILEEDLSWQVVWRYMMLFVEQYFVGFQF